MKNISTDETSQPSAAEVVERLKNWQWFCENTAKTFSRYEMPIEHTKELGETLSIAIALIKRGELERERLAEWHTVESNKAHDRAQHELSKEQSERVRYENLCSQYNVREQALRAQLAAATERVKQLEDALNFIVSGCDWEEGTATGDNRIGEACSKALAARAPKEGTP